MNIIRIILICIVTSISINLKCAEDIVTSPTGNFADPAQTPKEPPKNLESPPSESESVSKIVEYLFDHLEDLPEDLKTLLIDKLTRDHQPYGWYSPEYYSTVVTSATFNPAGNRIITTFSDGTAKLWDLQGRCLVIFHGHTDKIKSASFNPDGSRLITASCDKTAKLWDLGGNCLVTFKGHTDTLLSAIFNHDGNNIITTSRDGTTKLWDLHGNRLATLRSGICSKIFIPKNNHLVTISEKGIKQWNIKPSFLQKLLGYRNNTCLATFQKQQQKPIFLENSGDLVFSFSGLFTTFNPTSNLIVATFWDEIIELWDLHSNCLATFNGHTGLINSATLNPAENHLLTASRDGTAKLWKLDGTCITTFGEKSPHDSSGDPFFGVLLAAFDPNGNRVITTYWDGTVKLWDLNGICLATFQGHINEVLSVDFSSTDNHLITVSHDGTAKLWNLHGNCLATFSDTSNVPCPWDAYWWESARKHVAGIPS